MQFTMLHISNLHTVSVMNMSMYLVKVHISQFSWPSLRNLCGTLVPRLTALATDTSYKETTFSN